MKKLLLTSLFILMAVPTMMVAYQFDDFDDVEDVEKLEPSNEPESEEPRAEVAAKDIEAISRAKRVGGDAFIRAISKVLGRDDKNLKALNALAVYYFEKKNYGLAKIVLNRALESHSEQPALLNNLGIIYLAEGDIRKAIVTFKKAVEMDGGYRIGSTNLASIYLEYKDYSRALAPLESGYGVVRGQLEKGNETAIEVANNYAVALSGSGQGKKARDVYERILKGNSRNVSVLLNYAILLITDLKDKDEALSTLSRIKFVSDDPRVLRRVEKLEKEASAME